MKLFFRSLGKGNPLLILHGLFGISDNWMSFARAVETNYEVYLPDLRNHGRSPHSPVFNFQALENDILELVEDHNLHDIYLMGHSLGGKIAMNFAIHHPEYVKKLIVVDISPRKYTNNPEHQILIDAMRRVDFSTATARSAIDLQLKEKIQSPKLRQFLLKNVYWRDRENLDWRLNLASIDQNLPAVLDEIEPHGVFHGPTLFVRGGLSFYIPDEDIIPIKNKFPRAVVTTIENASHWVHADARGEFLRIVSGFLEQINND